jgi:hypothetical protein
MFCLHLHGRRISRAWKKGKEYWIMAVEGPVETAALSSAVAIRDSEM